MNNRDIEKTLTFLMDDTVFETRAAKVIGKDQFKAMLEFDGVNNTHSTNTDIRVEGGSATMKNIEKNDALRLMGIDEYISTATTTLREGMIEKIALERGRK